jgi:hypothetical protein
MANENHPPYKHWHAVCAACSQVILARPCSPPAPIEPLRENPVVRCSACGDTRQYLVADCFLAPLSAGGAKPRSDVGVLALIAGFWVVVRLAKVESREIAMRSPRVRAAVSDGVLLAKAVLQAVQER